MRRAFIITFFDEINYGAVLQSYALQTKLKDYYQEVSIINYQPKIMKDKKKLLNMCSLKSFLLSVILLRQNIKRQNSFSTFIENRLNVKDLTLLQNDDSHYENDVFLGSDQIWNPRITGGVDPVFYGILPNLKWRKSIAYAPSFGVNNLKKEELEGVATFLPNIDCLSVREREAKYLLASCTEKEIQVVCDPTLLLTTTEWQRMIKTPAVTSEYIFTYSLSQDSEVSNTATKLSQILHIPVIEIYLGKKPKKATDGNKVLFSLSPEEFLGYIYKSKYVVTDSFHGTVFSIIFHKDFYSVPFKGKEGRIKDLLGRCDLSNRMVSSIGLLNPDDKIDYTKVDQKLSLFREQSTHYIEESIK